MEKNTLDFKMLKLSRKVVLCTASAPQGQSGNLCVLLDWVN